MVDRIAAYWRSLDGPDAPPVRAQVRPGQIAQTLKHGNLAALPEHGRDAGEVVSELCQAIAPGLTHWQSPNFFAFFPANGSPPAVLGEMLMAGLGVNGMLWATSPSATELEQHTLELLADACGLPERFHFASGGGSVIQGTASEAAVVALVAARHRLRKRAATSLANPAEFRPVVYCSAQAHSSIQKAAMICGLADDASDVRHVRLIEVDSKRQMRMDVLAQAMAADVALGLHPCMVTATMGTTGSLAFDDVSRAAELCREHNAWLHVDGAMAGAACICPEHRWMLAGLEHADSYCFNPHKWLLVNFDCDVLYVADRDALTSALSITPEYLRNTSATGEQVVDYRDWQIPLGRRFRAIKLHMVLHCYGISGLRQYIAEHVRLTSLLAELLASQYEIIDSGRGLNLLCLRPHSTSQEARDARTLEILRQINDSGAAYLTHTVLPFVTPDDATLRPVIRICVGSTYTQERHVRQLAQTLCALAK